MEYMQVAQWLSTHTLLIRRPLRSKTSAAFARLSSTRWPPKEQALAVPLLARHLESAGCAVQCVRRSRRAFATIRR